MQELKKLLIEVTDHDTLDSNGDAPLHYFVKRKDKEKFKCLMTFLIHSKCNVNLLNVDGQTALHLACQVIEIGANMRQSKQQFFFFLFLIIGQ